MTDKQRRHLEEMVRERLASDAHPKEWKIFAEAVRAQRSDFLRLMQADHEERGRVVRAHLAIEFFLYRFLEETHPDFAWADARLTSAQLFELVPLRMAKSSMMRGALREVNKVRNRCAHRDYGKLEFADIPSIISFLNTIGSAAPCASPVEAIEAFVDGVALLFTPPNKVTGAVAEVINQFQT